VNGAFLDLDDLAFTITRRTFVWSSTVVTVKPAFCPDIVVDIVVIDFRLSGHFSPFLIIWLVKKRISVDIRRRSLLNRLHTINLFKAFMGLYKNLIVIS